MPQINVSNVTFCYEGSFDNIFENVSFQIDTDWKLGFLGRNGKGKTTFLNLLLGKYEYQGSIHASTRFDYFPFLLTQEQRKLCAVDIMQEFQPEYEVWRVICELENLKLEAEVLYRPFETLSQGEQTKVMLAMLFSRENYFLLIDEPTNHLDIMSRQVVKEYLKNKKGFILVSHDRDVLDACIDHVLVLNRNSITIQKGNFSSWWENKEKQDSFEKMENEKHQQEITKLKNAVLQTSAWANKSEGSKIGFNPLKDHDRSKNARSYIGAKTKKLEKRRKNLEQRMEREISQKETLLKDLETVVDLKIIPLQHHKEVYISARDYGLSYVGSFGEKEVLKDFTLALKQGERVLLQGANGCGKSSFLKAVLRAARDKRSKIILEEEPEQGRKESGTLSVASGLIISYVNQDTSYLSGKLSDYIEKEGCQEHLLKALLRQLDFERVQFEKNIEEYSEGQKKKLLLATSLITEAHLYIWDEPFNYIDVFSRMQIENLILKYQPTMLLVEHDPVFGEKAATRIIPM